MEEGHLPDQVPQLGFGFAYPGPKPTHEEYSATTFSISALPATHIESSIHEKGNNSGAF